MEYRTTAEEAKLIRQELKRRYGWTGRDVSVRSSNYSMGSSINIKVKVGHICSGAVEEIANEYQSISRCEITGDILSGGNRFIFVEYSHDAEAAIGEPYKVDIQAIRPEHGFVPVGGCTVACLRWSENDWDREYSITHELTIPADLRTYRGHHEHGDLRVHSSNRVAFAVGYYSDILPGRIGQCGVCGADCRSDKDACEDCRAWADSPGVMLDSEPESTPALEPTDDDQTAAWVN